jgi:hypothetical protein
MFFQHNPNLFRRATIRKRAVFLKEIRGVNGLGSDWIILFYYFLSDLNLILLNSDQNFLIYTRPDGSTQPDLYKIIKYL